MPAAHGPCAQAGAARLLAAVPPALTTAALLAAACWRIGEPTPGPALVTWAAYPETVITGEVFSFEFAGPVSPTTCGRLDTAHLAIRDSAILLSAERSTFDANCAEGPISFYEARPIRIETAGRYPVRTAGDLALGTLVAVDSGEFSAMTTIGLGTAEEAAGCLLFGPGWMGNQRPFVLRGAPEAIVAAAGTGRLVWIRGTLYGFGLCGGLGSRPAIRVDTAWVTDRTVDDYYDDET